MDRLIRIGKVSKIDYEYGMIAVTFSDLDDAVTVPLASVSFNDEYKMPKVGDEVLSLHLPSGQSRGLVLGKYWNKTNIPPSTGATVYRKEYGHTYEEAYAEYHDGGELLLFAPSIKFGVSGGEITVSQIISRLSSLESRVTALEGRL